MTSAFVKTINSMKEFNELSKKEVLIIDFHAVWCGPCKMIAPTFAELANTHFKSVTFARVDVDKVKDVAKKFQVTAMPTFIVLKNGEKADEMKGADPMGLGRMVKKWAATVVPSNSEEGSSGANSGDISLLEFLDTSQVNCLNENPEHTLKAIVTNKVRNTTNAYLESDADEQLLITLAFIQTVRVRSLVLHTANAPQGPKKIKILINKTSIGFEDAEDAEEPEAVQVFDVPEDFVKEGKHIQLRFVRLQRVDTLHIFVASNHGDEDETRIDSIDVFGQPVGTQMGRLQKIDD